MRAKFVVERVYNNGQNMALIPVKEVAAKKLFNPETRKEVILEAEVPPPPENAAFFSASPGGEISLLMVRSVNAAEFTEGRAFFVDFTPAD